MPADDDTPEDAPPPEHHRFRSELIKAISPAIYGSSWIPIVKVLVLLLVPLATIIATFVVVRGLLP